jgi:hypothetical protein
VDIPGGIIEAARVVAFLIFLLLAATWLSVVVWTARDISLRTTNVVERGAAVLVAGLLFPIGYFLYRAFRPSRTLQERYFASLEEEAIIQGLAELRACGTCGRRSEEGYLYCPFCVARLKHPCPSCKAAMEPAWAVCAYCGCDRTAAPVPPAIPAAVAAAGG